MNPIEQIPGKSPSSTAGTSSVFGGESGKVLPGIPNAGFGELVDKHIDPVARPKQKPEAQSTVIPGDGSPLDSIIGLHSKVRHELLSHLLELAGPNGEDRIVSQFEREYILYHVPAGTLAADVPDYWNAENTSQRLVNFALSFRQYFADLSDVDFLEKIRSAMLEGFARAKEDEGDVPYDLAQLYNDTYRQTMGKVDRMLDEARDRETKEA